MTRKVSIIGAAGTLGSCAAYAIATQGLADELVLLDLNENLLKCHVLDLETAVTGIRQMDIIAGQYSDLAGSDVVIMSAGAPWRFITNRMELLGDSLPIIRAVGGQIAKHCPDAVVITATNPVDPLNLITHMITGMDRRKLLGYSINDSFRFRKLAARLLKADSSRVEGITVGEHGPHQVMLFSTLRVAGSAVDLDDEQKQKVRDGVPAALRAFESLRTGRTTGWTSAVGLSAITKAILDDSGEVYPCSVLLDGELGYEGLSASLPVRLGRAGAGEIVLPPLTQAEEAEFKAAMAYLEEAAASAASLLN